MPRGHDFTRTRMVGSRLVTEARRAGSDEWFPVGSEYVPANRVERRALPARVIPPQVPAPVPAPASPSRFALLDMSERPSRPDPVPQDARQRKLEID